MPRKCTFVRKSLSGLPLWARLAIRRLEIRLEEELIEQARLRRALEVQINLQLTPKTKEKPHYRCAR